MTDLVALPGQEADTSWPTDEWPEGRVPEGVDLDRWLDRAFDPTAPFAETLAVVVVHRGRLVAERYADAVDAATPLISWSMAKSVLHAAVGILVRDARLDPAAPAPVPLWHESSGDPRAAITLEHLLAMRDGLDFTEDYVDDEVSDVIEMLFGAGKNDVARFAADRPLAHRPGEHFNYSSGTSNIVSGIVRDVVGGTADAYRAWLRAELFGPVGMRSAEPRFDDAGTFVASSFLYATARDFARFGLLYLRGGEWEGRRIVPEGWVDHGREKRSIDPDDRRWHGAHWWILDDDHGTFWASGYEGQRIWVVPGLDLVVVRLGKMPEEQKGHLTPFMAEISDVFRR